jgi:hypothetical protein
VGDDLGGGQVVVVDDREHVLAACHPPDLADHAVGGGGDRAAEDLSQQIGGVVAGHPAAADGVVERVLEPLARDHHDVEWVQHTA